MNVERHPEDRGDGEDWYLTKELAFGMVAVTLLLMMLALLDR